MSEVIVQEQQSIIDMAILAYGRPSALLQLIQDNEAAFTDSTKAVPEVELVPDLEPGQVLTFDEANEAYDVDVIKVLEREPLKLATLPEWQPLPSGFDFNSDFSNDFLAPEVDDNEPLPGGDFNDDFNEDFG